MSLVKSSAIAFNPLAREIGYFKLYRLRSDACLTLCWLSHCWQWGVSRSTELFKSEQHLMDHSTNCSLPGKPCLRYHFIGPYPVVTQIVGLKLFELVAY